MSTRTILLASASLLAMTSAFVQSASAQCVTTGTITGTCNASVSVTGDLVVGPTGIVNGSPNSWGIRNPVHAAFVTNAGQINALWGITNSYIIDTLTNSGTINGVDKGGVAFLNAPLSNIGALIHTGAFNVNVTGASPLSISALIENDGGTINSATIGGTVAIAAAPSRFVPNARVVHNSGSIGSLVTSSTMTIVGSNAVGVYNTRYISTAPYGTITSYTNSGTLDVTGSSVGHGILNEGTFGTVVNSGTIIARNGLTSDTAGISNVGTISSIENTSTGAISATKGFALYNQGQIGSVINSGSMSGAQIVILNNTAGTITSLTNRGALQSNYTGAGQVFAINNTGNIGTLTDTGSFTFTAGGVSYIANPGAIGTLNAGGTVSISTSIASAWVNGVINSGTITAANVSGTFDLAAENVTGVYNGTIGGAGSIEALNISGQITARGENAWGVQNRGSITSFVNSGTVAADGSSAYGFENVRSLGSLTNTGVISADGGSTTGIKNALNGTVVGTIGLLDNRGTITATGTSDAYGIENLGAIGTLTNSGTISATDRGISNSNTIGALTNSGAITVRGLAVDNNGVLNSLTNSGAISSEFVAIENSTYMGTLVNSGEITATGFGAITHDGWSASEDYGIATITNSGKISVAANSWASAIWNYNGATDTLTNAAGGTISATGLEAYGVINGQGYTSLGGEHASIGQLTNDGVINAESGGSIAGSVSYTHAFGVINSSDMGTLTNRGVISATANYDLAEAYGVYNSGTIAKLSNSGSITAESLNRSHGISNWNVLTELTNAVGGTISVEAQYLAAGIANESTTVSGSTIYGSIGALTNAGVITVTGVGTTSSDIHAFGVHNQGQIGSLTNTGTIEVSVTGVTPEIQAYGIQDEAGGVEIVNSGVIKAKAVGDNARAIGIQRGNDNVGELTNSGLIYAEASGTGAQSAGIHNWGGIETLFNSGTIHAVGPAGNTGAAFGVVNTGTIGTLTNSGTIEGNRAVYNFSASSTIGALVNSGTIRGDGMAIISFGAMGTITNSGLIDGNVMADHALTFVGGSGTAAGTLTNGAISVAPGVTFASGNMVLDESSIYVSTNAVTNSGAKLTLSRATELTGSYRQTAGSLVFGSAGYLNFNGPLSDFFGVHGNAAIAGNVDVAFDSAGNYLLGGTRTLIASGPGSSYGGATVNSLLTGISLTANLASTQDLVVTYANNYVGGTLASLTNSGNLMAAYPVYVAASGTLTKLINIGTLTGTDHAIYSAGVLGGIENSGTISGNIRSATAITVAGGTGSAVGVLTGGTITAPGVTFTSGNIALGDAIDVGTGTATNAGAKLLLTDDIAVAGNFAQSGGTIEVATGKKIVVSGNATMTGGSVTTSLSATGNYLATDTGPTLVSAASGSYSGLTINVGVTGLETGAASPNGKDLTVGYRNDYIGGTLESASNSGTIGGSYGLYVAVTGNLGVFTNTGTVNGTTEAIHNAGSLGPIANSGTINGAISSVTDLSISGASGTAFGVLTGGDIAAPNVTFTGGNLDLADAITAASVSNTGASLRLASEVDVSGNYDQTSGTLIFRDGGKLVTGGTASLTGGVVRADFSSTGNYLTSDVGPTLISSTGLTYTGVTFQSSLTGLGMTASVVGNDLVVAYTNDYVGGTINTYTVDPAKTVSKGLYIASSGTIVSFTNSGTIGGENFAIDNEGSIGTFNNGGTILTNGADHGFINNGTIGTFNNTGTITGSDSDIFNTGQIGTFNNSGHIGSPIGVYIAAGGSISNLVNSGVIAGTQYAIYNAGTLGAVTNSGIIDGNISSANAFAIVGATGTAKGTLTGGTITAPGVTFSSGNTLLRDNIVANGGSGTVTNSGAKLEIDAKRTITGNYAQTGGTLAIDVTNGTTNYGSLVVSGAATMSGGTVTLTGTGLNYGQLYTIVDATGASSYSNLTVNAGQYVAIYSNVANDLMVRLGFQFRQIGTAAGGDAATMGGVFETLQAGNTGFVPVIEAFANVATADQGKILTQAAPAQVGGGAALLQRATLITEQTDSAIARHAQGKGTVWAALVGGVGERKSDGATQAYDVSSWGLVAGVDAVATDKLLLGGALSWSSGWNAGKDTLSANVNGVSSFGLTGYGFWADGPLAVNGRFTVGFDSYKQHRKIAMPNLIAEASYSGRHYGLAVEAGYDLSLASATLTPIAALKWLSLDADGYTETGAGVLNLKVGDASAHQVEGDLGAKLSWSLNTRLGELQPDLKVAWAHDFVDSDIAIDAAMLGQAFATSQARASADGLIMGAGLGLLCSGDTSLQLAYDGQFRSGYTSHSGMLRFRIAY